MKHATQSLARLIDGDYKLPEIDKWPREAKSIREMRNPGAELPGYQRGKRIRVPKYAIE